MSWQRRARAAFRLARLGLHLGSGAATAACVYPFLAHGPRLGLKQRWSRQLLTILGVHVERTGCGGPIAGLIVANHVSWLDIFVINALRPAAFVCKEEVRAWPLIGWLCEKTDTIFIERRSGRAARRTAGRVAQALAEGRVVAAFPEGTTSGGETVLPFHPALLQPAIDAGQPVRPVALAYADGNGNPCAAVAYAGETSFAQSLRAIASEKRIVVTAHLAAQLAAEGKTRRELAESARASITQALASRPARKTPGTLPAPAAEPPSDGLPTGSLNPAPAGSARS